MSLAYNTLFEIKDHLGGIALPPHTPLTTEAATVLKPEYVAGMGAIRADPERGLQCPICGDWFPKSLGCHVGGKHKDIGGVAGLKKLLGYSPVSALVTVAMHKQYHDTGTRSWYGRGDEKVHALAKATASAKRTNTGTRRTSGHGQQNMRLACQVQMVEHFHELAKKLGRQPTRCEWIKEKLPVAFLRESPVFKSWNQLVVAAGGIPHRVGSNGVGRLMPQREFCKHGHSLLDESNVAIRSEGGRRCRRCAELAQQRYSAKRAAARRAAYASGVEA